MKKRNVFGVFALTLFTFGIYGLVWQVKTKGELNSQGAQIPTAWLIIVPLVNIWWLWKYAEGVEHVTGMSGPVSFLLLFLLGLIGMCVLQDKFNGVADGGVPAQAAPADAAAVTPVADTSVAPVDEQPPVVPAPPTTPQV